MDDRALVQRLLEVGVETYKRHPAGYADTFADSYLKNVGNATLAKWLEELGRHQLIGDVQSMFTEHGGGFCCRYQVTDKAVRLVENLFHTRKFLDELLDEVASRQPSYDLFLSYAAADGALASELKGDLDHRGLKCFMAGKDIAVAADFQEAIRTALMDSKRVLIIITPRSLDKPWVLMETGAAWVLGKPLIPALVQIDREALPDPIRRYEARFIETIAQRRDLVEELDRLRLSET